MVTLLTQQEVEEILKVSKSTIERWRRQGCGPRFIRIGQGRTVRYKTEDLDVYLKDENTQIKGEKFMGNIYLESDDYDLLSTDGRNN